MTENFLEGMDIAQESLISEINNETDPDVRTKLILQLKSLNLIDLEATRLDNLSTDAANKCDLERLKLDLEKMKLEIEKEKINSNKETERAKIEIELEKLKLDEERIKIEKKGVDLDEEKIKIEQTKQAIDKQTALVNWLGLGASLVFGAAAYIWMPKTILKADQLGEYINYKALSYTDKPRMKLFDKIFRK